MVVCSVIRFGKISPLGQNFKSLTMKNIVQNLTINGISVNCVLRTRTQDRRMVGKNLNTELWWPSSKGEVLNPSSPTCYGTWKNKSKMSKSKQMISCISKAETIFRLKFFLSSLMTSEEWRSLGLWTDHLFWRRARILLLSFLQWLLILK